MTIQQDTVTLLRTLAEVDRDEYAQGSELLDRTGLDPGRVNDAVRILEDSGYVSVLRTMGTSPFDFRTVQITPAGRYELERATTEAVARADARDAQASDSEPVALRRNPRPVGSPFGFTELDWEFLELEKGKPKLLVVLGYQFKSSYYKATRLESNLKKEFQSALDDANRELRTSVALDFVLLRAGYGEHLFNQIARSIIASDIAVFETSNRNANVMIEMGVALTWGTAVHPIRHVKARKLPSDISGQTWARYEQDGAVWEDPDHYAKVVAMVTVAARKRAAGQ